MLEKGDKSVKSNIKVQLEMNIIMKNTDEPEFFKNYLESYPLSENWILRAESFYIESKGIPRNSMNSSIQSSVYKISK